MQVPSPNPHSPLPKCQSTSGIVRSLPGQPNQRPHPSGKRRRRPPPAAVRLLQARPAERSSASVAACASQLKPLLPAPRLQLSFPSGQFSLPLHPTSRPYFLAATTRRDTARSIVGGHLAFVGRRRRTSDRYGHLFPSLHAVGNRTPNPDVCYLYLDLTMYSSKLEFFSSSYRVYMCTPMS
jgi:hypothetical protein